MEQDPYALSAAAINGLLELSKELHQLHTLELFDDDEMDAATKKLIALQNNITGIERSVGFTVQYVEFQMQLINTLRMRTLEKPGLMKEALEWHILNNVKAAYQEAIGEFEDDHSLYIPYIKFCIKINETDSIVDWAMFFLQRDISNRTIWNILKQLYYKEPMDVKRAIWGVMPKLSATYVAAVMSERDFEGEGTCIKKLRNFLNMAFQHIRCSYFHVSILDNINDINIRKKVLKELEQNCYMWNAMAQQLWRMDFKPKYCGDSVTFRRPRVRLQQCIAKYKEGIHCLLPENKSSLWSMLINFLFFLYKNDRHNGISKKVKLKILNKYLNAGMEYYGEHQFLKWLKLEKDLTECLRISTKAITLFPTSVDLWRARLKYEYQKEDTSYGYSLFRNGLVYLREKSLPLWKDMIHYNHLSIDAQNLERIFWEGSEFCHEVSSYVRPMFLKWLLIHRSIDDVRDVYDILVEKEPHTKEMYVTMTELENMLTEDYFDESRAEKVHKDACSRFSCDMKIWTNYVQFLYNLNRRHVLHLKERLKVVHDKCLTALPPYLHSEFRLIFSKILTNSNS